MMIVIALLNIPARGLQDVARPSANSRKRQPPKAVSNPEKPSLFRITGTVVNSLTHAAITKAELAAAPMASGGSNRRFPNRSQDQTITATTDAAGHFLIELPSAGGWSLNASARGYHAQALDEHDGYSTGVVLTDAIPAFDLVFPLPPAAVIEGFVLDDAGEAVRNGQVSLTWLPRPAPGNPHGKPQVRDRQQTDDRGYYKFSGLPPGDYELRVQAQPWYSSSAAGSNQFGGLSDHDEPAASGPDPLDVVYPMVWYAGVTDHVAATPVTVHSGDMREADFRLLAIPGFHLRVAAAQSAGSGDVAHDPHPSQNVAYLSQIMPDGTETMMPTMRTEADGNVDIAGLAPGNYQVHFQDGQSPARSPTSSIQIGANSARTVELSQATPATPVSIKVDAGPGTDSLQIVFTNTETNTATYANRPGNGHMGGMRKRRQPIPDAASAEKTDDPGGWTASLQPGVYEVVLNGVRDLRLASIDATGATARGRMVTIGGGAPALALHVARGRATVTGNVRLHEKPDAGAMVVLIPAALGDASDLDIIRRDQSNSDGSFDLAGVLPGKYILIAIDHGWDVNWSDPATLRRFLMHGLPLEIALQTDLHPSYNETVEAQVP